MIITAKGIFTDEQVSDFAINELGYRPTLTEQRVVIDVVGENGDTDITHTENVEVNNPISKKEAIAEAFTKHVYSFFDKYQERKAREAVAEIEETLEATKKQAIGVIETLKEQSIEIRVE